jgi:hypothetical protein
VQPCDPLFDVTHYIAQHRPQYYRIEAEEMSFGHNMAQCMTVISADWLDGNACKSVGPSVSGLRRMHDVSTKIEHSGEIIFYSRMNEYR